MYKEFDEIRLNGSCLRNRSVCAAKYTRLKRCGGERPRLHIAWLNSLALRRAWMRFAKPSLF